MTEEKDNKKTLTFEERFDMLMEAFDKSHIEWQEIKESQKEIQKETAERFRETAEQFKETKEQFKETKKLIEANAKQIGGISESNGDMAEEMIYNSLEQDMTFAGIEFDDFRPNMGYKSKKLKLQAEFDIVLTNGDSLAIIETKYKVRKKHILELKDKKINDFRKLYPEYNNHKIILGIGGMSFEKDVEKEAKENGIGIIKVVGDKIEHYTDEIKVY